MFLVFDGLQYGGETVGAETQDTGDLPLQVEPHSLLLHTQRVREIMEKNGQKWELLKSTDIVKAFLPICKS